MSTSTSNTTNNNSFPKFVTDCRSAADGASGSAIATAGSSSTANNTAASSSGAKGPLPPPPPPPLNLCIVINICHYLTPLAKLIILSQPLDTTSGEAEREAFLALQQILSILDSGKNEPINVFPFLDKFCRYIGTNFSDFEEMDIFLVWDYLIKLITLVIPPLREIFMGRLSLSLDEHAWHSLTTRCVHAQFSHSVQSLEEFIKLTLQQFNKDYYNDLDLYQHRTSLESIKNYNAIILGRAPEILAFAVESPHLPSSLRFLDALSKNPNKMKPPATIKFPASFNMSMKEGEGGKSSKEQGGGTASGNDEEMVGNVYDLAAVVTLEGSNCENAQAFYRYVHEAASTTTSETGAVVPSQPSSQWYKGSGATHDLIESSRAIERNYFHINDNKKVHPRLLIYAKRGIVSILDQLRDFVTKGGQLRCKGDATFEAAETPEHYDEAKQYYEEAIAYDSSLRTVLQDRLNSLEQIERNQKAQSYENQADLSLGKKRFKEACDLYKLAMRSAVVNSPIYARIREKEDYMMRIISLEIANHLTEKGEECLKSGSYAQSRENFAQALKLNPNYIHLQSIIQGIDKLITAQTSAQKVSEANQAMKLGRYKYANQLFLEALNLVPERESALKPILDSLVVLMQGEDALMKQRSGLIALEDKKYSLAISLITEAITLLPPESVTEHAFFLCDRAQVYFEMKDYQTSIQDCQAALELRPELAVAYLRLGSAQFELELFDDALVSYEKAMRYDPSLNDQIKVKIRQVNTAKEIQQRKEREAERARIKEEEAKRIEEKRAREEKARKERQEKLQQEQAEKTERNLMQKEEKLIRTIMQKEVGDSAASAITSKAAKESAKEKAKREKVEKEQQKALEKERVKAEKEKERERVKAEKEAKLREEQAAKELELQKQREFTAEMERAQAKLKEAEREKEAEKERLRLERERIMAEKEKQRLEKEKKKQEEAALKAAVPATPVTPAKDKAKAAVPEKAVKSAAEKVESKPTTAAAVVAASLAASTPAKTAAAVVASASSSNSVDPDFPTLGAVVPPTILKRSESAPTPSAPSVASNPPVAPANKAKSNPPTKWSALLSSTADEGNANNEATKRPSSTSTLPTVTTSSKSVPSKPAAPQEEFPPLFDSNGNEIDAATRPSTVTPNTFAFDYKEVLEKPTGATGLLNETSTTNSSATPSASSSSAPTPAVLSSGELKAMIAKTTEVIPNMQLPQAAVTGQVNNLGNNDFSAYFQNSSSLLHSLDAGSSNFGSGNTSSNFGLGIFDPKHNPPIIPTASGTTSSSSTLLPTPEDSSSTSLLAGSTLNPLSSSFVSTSSVPPTPTLTSVVAAPTTTQPASNTSVPLTAFSTISSLASDLVEGSQLNANSAAFQPLMHDLKLADLDPLPRIGSSNSTTAALGSNSSLLGSSSLGGLEHDPFGGGGATRRTSRFTSLFGSSSNDTALGGNDILSGSNLLGSIGSGSSVVGNDLLNKDPLGINLGNNDSFGMNFGSGYSGLGGFGGSSNSDIFGSSSALLGNDRTASPFSIPSASSNAESSRLAKILGGFGSNHSSSNNLLDHDPLKTPDLPSLSGGGLFGSSGVSSTSNVGIAGNDPFSFLDTSSGLIGPASSVNSSIPGLWMQDNTVPTASVSAPTTAAGLLGLRGPSSAIGPANAGGFGVNNSSLLGANTLGSFQLGGNGYVVASNQNVMVSPMMSMMNPPIMAVPARKIELPQLGKQLEDEMITDYNSFPALQRLATYNIHLYRWAFSGNEWVEYALPLTDIASKAIELNGGFPKLIQLSGCEMRLVEMTVRNQRERVLILSRGMTGIAVQQVLELLSNWVMTSYPKPSTFTAPATSNLLNTPIASSNSIPPAPALVQALKSPATGPLSSPKLTGLPMSVAAAAAVVSAASSANTTPALTALPPPPESAPASTATTNKWASLPQSIFESQARNSTKSTVSSAGDFTVTDSMIDSLISSGNEISEKAPTLLPPAVDPRASPALGTSAPPTPVNATPASASSTASAAAKPTAPTATTTATTTSASTESTATTPLSTSSAVAKTGPNLLKPAIHPGTGVAKRYLEIPAELIGLVIGHGGKKIKELATESGSKVQFKTSKTSEREGKPGILELQGTVDNVDKAATMVWELLQSVGREYREITGQPSSASASSSTTTSSSTTVSTTKSSR